MGLTVAKFIPHFDIGLSSARISEEQIKKANYTKVLSTESITDEPQLEWQFVQLDENNTKKNVAAFILGCKFIQNWRMEKENVLLLVNSRLTEGIAFASAYAMLLSGLNANDSDQAVRNAIKTFKLTIPSSYMKSLEALRQSGSPQKLREDMFSKSKPYAISLLSTDVACIYQFADLPKPSLNQVKLVAEDMSPTVTKAPVEEAPKPESANKVAAEKDKPASGTVVAVETDSQKAPALNGEKLVEAKPSSPKPSDSTKPAVKDDKPPAANRNSVEVKQGFHKILTQREEKDDKGKVSVSPESLSSLMKVKTLSDSKTAKQKVLLTDSTVVHIEESLATSDAHQQPDSKSLPAASSPLVPSSAPEIEAVTPVLAKNAESAPQMSPPLKALEQPPSVMEKGKVHIIFAPVDKSRCQVLHVDEFLANRGNKTKRMKVKIIMAPEAVSQ